MPSFLNVTRKRYVHHCSFNSQPASQPAGCTGIAQSCHLRTGVVQPWMDSFTLFF